MYNFWPVLLLVDDTHAGSGQADATTVKRFNLHFSAHAHYHEMLMLRLPEEQAVVTVKGPPSFEEWAKREDYFRAMADAAATWLRKECYGELDALFWFACHRGSPLYMWLDVPALQEQLKHKLISLGE